MLAQFNPSRMAVIAEIASNLAERLQRLCPKCKIPGWGRISKEKGLKCSWCGSETELVKSEIYGLVSVLMI